MRTLRTPSDKEIAKTLLEIYRQNRLAVVDVFCGELVPFNIKEYVDTLATGRSLRKLMKSKRT